MIDLLIDRAGQQPDAPFVIHDDDTWSFATMVDLALRGASLLDELGVMPEDRVVVAVSNRPLFLFYWFALSARGAVAVPIAHDAFGEALAYIVTQSRAAAVLTEASQADRIRATLDETSVTIVSFASEAAFSVEVASLPRCTPIARRRDATAAILYTSGTTGQPKGALIPEGSYRAAGREIVSAVAITAADRILVFLPLHHANPQMYALMSALTAGCSLVLVDRFSASRMLLQAERHRATGFTYVGTVLSILSKAIAGPQATTLRWCVGGGAPEPVWRDLAAKLDLRIHELYGMTETGGVTTINSHTHARIGSVGRPRDDFEVVLLDDDDRVIDEGIGEIAVRPRGPALITTGYFEKPDETLSAMGNLWFHTGDFGRFDADGFLFFEGRKKELIRRAGEMISPVAIEQVALRHRQVAECAAVAVSDEILGEDIKLVVVERAPLDHDDLMAFLALHLPRHALPRYIDIVDAIPKTPTEKIQRFKLQIPTPRLVDIKPHLS